MNNIISALFLLALQLWAWHQMVQHHGEDRWMWAVIAVAMLFGQAVSQVIRQLSEIRDELRRQKWTSTG